MRAYRVQLGGRIRFEPNQTEARATRQQMEADASAKRGAGSIDEVEIPTGKDHLLGWVNETLEQALKKLGERP